MKHSGTGWSSQSTWSLRSGARERFPTPFSTDQRRETSPLSQHRPFPLSFSLPPTLPRYLNSTRNDLSWWGLDYPPLSGYQSWLHGKLLKNYLLPEEERELALALTEASRGFESPASKRAMRAAVLASDALVWLPCALAALFVFSSSSSSTPKKKEGGEGEELLWPAAVVLFQPALLLIDHGHFQFNGIGLGLAAAAAAAAATDRRIWASILFTCSLNHKQMALYFAPAFFGHLLGRCLQSAAAAASKKTSSTVAARKDGGGKENTSSSSSLPFSSSLSSMLLFLFRAGLYALPLGLAVALTMAALWWPVISRNANGPLAGAMTVLSRLAPVQRGVFEDYVSNFWCATHPVFKWKRRFSKEQLARAAAALTLAAAAPSTLHQALRPSRRGMLYGMACSSLAFYLFSYQVHEKSILLPLLPVSLLALGDDGGGSRKQEKKKTGFFFSSWSSAPPSEPFLASWLPVAACFSMWPLLERDGLAWSYAGCLVLWLAAVVASRPGAKDEGEEEEEKGRQRQKKQRRSKADLALLFGPAASVAGALALHACHALVEPPAALPWLWDAAITSYCSLFFFAAFVYLNLRMWKSLGGGREREEAETATTRGKTAPRRAGPK